LALLASEGDTKNEIMNALDIVNLENGIGELHESVGALFRSVKDTTKSANISTAFGVFVQSDFQVKNTYLENAKKYYGSEVQSVDFGKGDEAKNTINQWVSKETSGFIPQLLSDAPDSTTKVVLGSALYFQAKWKYPFSHLRTKTDQFYTYNGNVEVNMMTNRKRVYYGKDLNGRFEVLGIPYENDEAVFFILLPKSIDLDTLLDTMEFEEASGAFRSAKKHDVVYKIPKFTVDFSKSLRETLNSLGIKKMFDKSVADLSNLGEGTYVSKVFHKTKLEVTEVGTVAAASTTLDIEPRSFAHTFITVNKPFFFSIYHFKSKLVLFSGVVYKP